MSLDTVLTHNTALTSHPTLRPDGCALVLMGGGARTAYQAGVLKALMAMLPSGQPAFPFHWLFGTSAGALNASYLASQAGDGDLKLVVLALQLRALRFEQFRFGGGLRGVDAALGHVGPRFAIAAARFLECGERLARAIAPGQPGDAAGTLVINPHSFVRRIGVELPGLAGLPTVERPVYAADQVGSTSQVVVDVPGMGFVHLAPGKPPASDRKSILLVEENTLRNEFFEAIISPTTGTLASCRTL